MRRMPQLYAITTVYNPAGYESRFRLYREFAKRLEKSGVALYTVELATFNFASSSSMMLP